MILLCQVLKVDLPDYDWDRARTRGDVPPEKVKLRIQIMIEEEINRGNGNIDCRFGKE